jgi:hypothetical protein
MAGKAGLGVIAGVLAAAVAAATVALVTLGSASGEAARVERCTDRLLSRARLQGDSERERARAQRYVKSMYCERFERRGWIYDDGTLNIRVQGWLVNGGRCEVTEAVEPGRPPGEPHRVPCREVEEGGLLDCALLHHVRRGEVRAHVAGLRRRHSDLRCDDGSPLADLGVR